MKKILLLNAGHSEEPLIKELKGLGCYVITSGKKSEFKGHKMADEYIYEDYSDKEAILKICKEKKMDGIVSCAHDYGLVTAAYVCEHMGWKGHDTYENTLLLHQKDLFKQLCVELDLPSPRTYQFVSEEAAYEYIENVDYPIIVKAVDQASGIGIMKAACEEESIVAIKNSFDKSKEKRIVIEPFILGTQESYIAFVVNGKVISDVACNCYSPINPYLIQTETLMSDNYEIVKPILCDVIEKIFSTLNLVDGIITIQYIVKDGKPYIIEAMRRCLGNQFLTAAEAVSGFPWHKALVMSELGLDCSKLKSTKPLGKFAGHHAIMSVKNGIYQGMSIPDDIMEHVFKYSELFEKGEEIKNYMNERMGYIYYTYDTKEEIDVAARTFNERIKLDVV